MMLTVWLTPICCSITCCDTLDATHRATESTVVSNFVHSHQSNCDLNTEGREKTLAAILDATALH